jgi:glycosyltransferase involved in cell wall biosynthesis/O-antigen/teichoic acid export membrane protein
MNILIVSGIFPPDAGGPATYVQRMAHELSAQGHRVRVVTLADRPIASDGAPFRLVRIRRPSWLPLRMLQATWAILREGRDADVLFVNGLPVESAIANLYLQRPVVQKIVGDWAWERSTNAGRTADDFQTFQRSRSTRSVEALKWLRGRLAARADRVIVPSAFLAEIVAGWGVNRDRVRVIHNAIDPSTPDTVEGRARSPVRTIVTVGRLVKWKGVDDLIRVVRALPPDVQLSIVGDGPEEQRLRDLAGTLGIASRVRFLGRLERSRTLATVSASDVFVLNSTYEGLPHVVLEAMQCGVPVVATAAGGTGEVVRDGETGLLVPPQDVAALEAALVRILSDESLRRSLGAAGQAAVRQFFAPERMVDETVRELGTVAERHEMSAGTGDEAVVPTRRNLRKQAAVLGIISIGGAALGMIQGVIVARLLGPVDFGAVALLIAYPALVTGILDARSSDFSMKYLGQFANVADRDKASGICALGFLIDLAVTLLTLAFVVATGHWAAARVVRIPDAAELMLMYSASLIARVPVGTLYATLVLFGRWNRLLWAELGSAALRTVVIVALACAGFGVRGVIWGNVAGLVLEGAAYSVAGLPIVARAWGAPRLTSLQHLKGMWHEVGRFVGFSELHALLLTLPRQLDLLLVGSLAGPQQAGYFRLGRTFQSGLWLLGAPLQQIAFRQLSLLRGQRGAVAAKQFVTRFAGWVAAVLTLPLLVLILALPLVIHVLVGEAYLGASTAVRLLVAATALWVLGAWIRPWFLTAGQIDRYTTRLGLALIPYAIIAVLATPAWGAGGMALGYLTFSIVMLAPLAIAVLK